MRKTLILAAVAAFTAFPALAADTAITIVDPYARVSMMGATSGAAFMVIENAAETDDRLTAARSDIADKVELHTHKADAAGVMQMIEVPEGFPIPAKGSHALARGGDHIMFLGLKQPLKQDEKVSVTLVFEKAGEITLDVPVDLNRKDGMPMGGMKGMQGMQGMGGGMAAPSN